MLSDVMLIAVMPFLNGFMVELLTCAALFVWELPRRPRFGVRCGVSVAVVILIGEVTYILQWPNIQSALGNYYWWVWCIILRFFLLYVLCYWAIRQCRCNRKATGCLLHGRGDCGPALRILRHENHHHEIAR